MKLDVCTPTQLRAKSRTLLRLAAQARESDRSDLMAIGTEQARLAHVLSDREVLDRGSRIDPDLERDR